MATHSEVLSRTHFHSRGRAVLDSKAMKLTIFDLCVKDMLFPAANASSARQRTHSEMCLGARRAAAIPTVDRSGANSTGVKGDSPKQAA